MMMAGMKNKRNFDGTRSHTVWLISLSSTLRMTIAFTVTVNVNVIIIMHIHIRIRIVIVNSIKSKWRSVDGVASASINITFDIWLLFAVAVLA